MRDDGDAVRMTAQAHSSASLLIRLATIPFETHLHVHSCSTLLSFLGTWHLVWYACTVV